MLIGAPVLAVIVYFVLVQSKHQDTGQQLEITKMDREVAKFDQAFDRNAEALGVTPLGGGKTPEIKALEDRQAQLQAEHDAERTDQAETIKSVKDAAEEAAKAQTDEIQKRLKEQQK